MARISFRTRLRAFQAMRGSPPDPGFLADLEYLEDRDLDLSIRLGALLAFNALLLTVGTHPISASPGSPLSVDAGAQPVLTVASIAALMPLAVSSWCCLRAMLLGEEFETGQDEENSRLRRHLFASFVRSVEAQARMLGFAIRCTMGGAGATLALWAVIVGGKLG